VSVSKNHRIFVALILTFTLSIPINLVAQPQKTYSEYEVKIAFILNFLKFIEWPHDSTEKERKTFNFYVIGYGPLCEALEALDGKNVKGKTIIVKKIKKIIEISEPDVVFVGQSEQNHIRDIVNVLKNRSVLTIGDTEGYAKNGIMINLYMEMRKVRFEINVDAATKAKLRISSRLLSLSRIIDHTP